MKRLLHIDRVAGQNLVISTNLKLRNDGFPRSDQRKPDDPAVCVYFYMDGKPLTFPCDTYDTVEGNIAAIAVHIEATRSIERHGGRCLDCRAEPTAKKLLRPCFVTKPSLHTPTLAAQPTP